jgi:diguanylate cyclase (GGDEF)-like protein
MEKFLTRILLVEDNPGDARLILEALKETGRGKFEIEVVDTLNRAIDRLLVAERELDIVLLDLSLPDSQGLDTFRTIHARYPTIPILVLSGVTDEGVAFAAVNEGAQDFLIKGRVDSDLLPRIIRYSIERHNLLDRIRQEGVVDELTGIANRRGFLILSEHQRSVADRKGVPLSLLYIDLDRFKSINDMFGHREGDHALKEAANVMLKTFRRSDIVGRLGGDEFCVLLVENSPEGVRTAIARMHANVTALNEARRLPFQLAMSVGTATYDPAKPCSIEQLMVMADRSMYENKLQRKGAA